jgi:hypothetical protein
VKHLLALCANALLGCKTKVVELGIPDARVDAAKADAPSTCRCRITPCRVAGDCAAIGGACGADLFCVGDFGTCTNDSDCQATVSSSVCTQGTTSTTACP